MFLPSVAARPVTTALLVPASTEFKYYWNLPWSQNPNALDFRWEATVEDLAKNTMLISPFCDKLDS